MHICIKFKPGKAAIFRRSLRIFQYKKAISKKPKAKKILTNICFKQ